MQMLFGFILAMSVTMVLIPLLMRWAAPLGILDIPEARKVHAMPIPRVGGIAMVVGVMLGLLLWDHSTRPMQALALSCATLLVFGVWDDRKTLAAAPKFAGQAIAVLVAMAWGQVSAGSVTLSERMPLPAEIALPLTFLFLLGGTNAFNLADGLDGLAGGMGVLCLCGTALLAYTVGDGAVGAAAVMMVGALIGFLRFNTHPARVFMGDAGSQVLGFCAAFLALLLTQDPGTPLSTALPLLLLGVPIIDTGMVMIERLLDGVSPFRADRRHIHHRLLSLGFAHREAVSLLYLLQGGLLVAAWLMRYDPDSTVAAVFTGFALLVVLPLRLAQHAGWRVRPLARTPAAPSEPAEPVASQVRPSGRFPWLPTPSAIAHGWAALSMPSTGAAALALGLLIYAVRVLLVGARLSHDLQLLAIALAAILVAGLLLRRGRSQVSWSDKVALYSCAALAIFLRKHGLHPGLPQALTGAPLQLFDYVLYGVLAVAMGVCVRGSGDQAFRITPLDILVLLIVATVPNLPDSVALVNSLGLSVAETVLLFYSLEALTLVSGRRWPWLSGAAALFLVGLTLR